MSANNVEEQPDASSDREHELTEISPRQQYSDNSIECGPSDANELRNDVGNACMQWETEDQEKQIALGKLRDGKTYDDEELGDFERFPDDNYDLEAYHKAKEKYVFFWQSHSIYSQWNSKRKFYVDERQFKCAEQFMMYKKAALFGDWKIADEILWCKSPRQIKALGREVKGFDEKVWSQHRLYIVKEGNMEKFTQNEDFLADLLLTYPKLLVEASPLDKIWGIGREVNDPKAWDESTWDGKNYLGYVLTEVRDDIMVARGMIDEKDRERYIDRLVREAGHEPMAKTTNYNPECEDYLLFSKGIYSQWHHSWFEVDKIKFRCAEQFMMYKKATLFQDNEIAQKILKCNDPKKMKEFGRKVKGFNEKTWDHHCLHIVKEGNLAKFNQNDRLWKAIITTYPKVLVEANPYDKIWGIGLGEDNPNAKNKNTWRGKNCLGYILTEVRDEILFDLGLIKKEKVGKYIDKLQADWGTPVDVDFQNKKENYARNEKYIPGLHVESPKHKKSSKSRDVEKNEQREKYIPGLHVESPDKHKKGGKTTDVESPAKPKEGGKAADIKKSGREEKYIPGLHFERPNTDNKSLHANWDRRENQESMVSEHNAENRFVNHGGQNASSNIKHDTLRQDRNERKEEGKNKIYFAKGNDKRATNNGAAQGTSCESKGIDEGKTEVKTDQVETMSRTQRKKLEKAQQQSENQNNHDEDDNNGDQAAPKLSLRQKKNLKKKLKKEEEPEQEQKGKKKEKTGKKGKK